jgi:ABC-type transport system substrate-binding protein
MKHISIRPWPFLLGAVCLLGGAWLASGQGPKGTLPEEEWDPNYKPPNKVIPLPPDNKTPPKPVPKPAAPPLASVDLRRAAREARNPAVKKLYTGLATPHDLVNLRSFTGVKPARGGGEVAVRPDISVYVGDNPDALGKQRLELEAYDAKWHVQKDKVVVTAGLIMGVRHYEEIARDRVKAFLGQPVEGLSRLEQLRAAEVALTAVLRFHRSARERKARTGDEWVKVESGLRKELLTVLLGEVDELARAKEWASALALLERLSEEYTQPAELALMGPRAIALLEEAAKEDSATPEQLREVRHRLRRLEALYPNRTALEPIRKGLRRQAAALYEKAKELKKDPATKARALKLADLAAEIDPYNSELRAYRLQLADEYPMLRVGVPSLPERLSPALAATDTERRCVELLFESLVEASPTESGVVRYRPGLSLGRPRVVPLGRRFRIPTGACWSNGDAINVADVGATIALLKEGKGCGLPAAWGSLLDTPRGGRDWVEVTLTQGYLSPLSLMTFKVLPGHSRNRVDKEAFASEPIGSGPFTYNYKEDRGFDKESGKEFVRFLVNPYYSGRAGNAGRPRLQEVRLFAYGKADAANPNPPEKAFRELNLHLALDVTAKQAVMMKPAPGTRVKRTTATGMNRRIYFVAINQRKPALTNADRRRALALAINREALLDAHLRPLRGDKPDRKVHQVLRGPYPKGSWPADPQLAGAKGRLYNPDLARELIKRAHEKDLMGREKLTLKYPAGDPDLAAAMEALCKQVRETLSTDVVALDLVAKEVEPHLLREQVEGGDYQLAYYHYDFPDGTYWLWPLLGSPPGGENYLGFQGVTVQNLLREATHFRDFRKVQERTRLVHRLLVSAPEKGEEPNAMPFIPLWQLDTYVLIDEHLKTGGPLDPSRIFTGVEDWRFDRR